MTTDQEQADNYETDSKSNITDVNNSMDDGKYFLSSVKNLL